MYFVLSLMKNWLNVLVRKCVGDTRQRTPSLYKALEDFFIHKQILLQANGWVIPYLGIWRGRGNGLVGDYKLLAKQLVEAI